MTTTDWAIGEAPLLVAAAPVQVDSSSVEFEIEGDSFDTRVGVSPPVAFCGRAARRRVREVSGH